MATTVYKRLGATSVVSSVDTLGYMVSGSNSSVISSIVVCNTGTTTAQFRVAICPSSISAVVLADFVYYNVAIEPYDTFIATVGFTMSAGNQVLVRADSSNVVFSLFGSEVVP